MQIKLRTQTGIHKNPFQSTNFTILPFFHIGTTEEMKCHSSLLVCSTLMSIPGQCSRIPRLHRAHHLLDDALWYFRKMLLPPFQLHDIHVQSISFFHLLQQQKSIASIHDGTSTSQGTSDHSSGWVEDPATLGVPFDLEAQSHKSMKRHNRLHLLQAEQRPVVLMAIQPRGPQRQFNLNWFQILPFPNFSCSQTMSRSTIQKRNWLKLPTWLVVNLLDLHRLH